MHYLAVPERLPAKVPTVASHLRVVTMVACHNLQTSNRRFTMAVTSPARHAGTLAPQAQRAQQLKWAAIRIPLALIPITTLLSMVLVRYLLLFHPLLD